MMEFNSLSRRRTFIGAHRRDSLAHVRDLPRILYDDLFCLVWSQILEFLQHLLRCPKVKRRLVITVLKSLSCHDDPAVYLVLGVQEVNVAGGADRFSELVSQWHNFLVDVD